MKKHKGYYQSLSGTYYEKETSKAAMIITDILCFLLKLIELPFKILNSLIK